MRATPIINGLTYLVEVNGFPIVVEAANGADALRAVAGALAAVEA